MLDENPVAFRNALARQELASGLVDNADILVTHDDVVRNRRLGVELDIGAADAGDLHLQQRAVFGDIGHRIFAELDPARAGPDGRLHFFHHGKRLQNARLRFAGHPRAVNRPVNRLVPLTAPPFLDVEIAGIGQVWLDMLVIGHGQRIGGKKRNDARLFHQKPGAS